MSRSPSYEDPKYYAEIDGVTEKFPYCFTIDQTELDEFLQERSASRNPHLIMRMVLAYQVCLSDSHGSRLAKEHQAKARHWCDENDITEYEFIGFHIFFANVVDAVAFKLWSSP